MRIGMDARLVFYRRAGTGTYIAELLQALLALDRPDDTYYLLESRKAVEPVVSGKRVIRRGLWTPPHNRFEQLTLPLELASLPLDVLHSPDFIPPFRRLRKCASVITIHDLAFMLYPEILTADSKAYYGQVGKAVKHAGGIIAVSQATAKDIIERLDAPPDRVHVIYEAADTAFRPYNREDKDEQAKITAAYNKFGLPADYILFVGTIEPRKNIPTLLRAYHLLRERRGTKATPTLVIAGQYGWLYQDVFKLAKELKLGDTTRFIGRVDKNILISLYNGAKFLVGPSLYEGFYLPALEAMACGTPVIASNVSSPPEVIGDAGILLDPKDVDAWATAMDRLLDDYDLRADLSKRGIARAACFSWDRAARATREVYSLAVGRP